MNRHNTWLDAMKFEFNVAGRINHRKCVTYGHIAILASFGYLELEVNRQSATPPNSGVFFLSSSYPAVSRYLVNKRLQCIDFRFRLESSLFGPDRHWVFSTSQMSYLCSLSYIYQSYNLMSV